MFISCRAVNKYVPEETLEDQWKISVLFPPVTNLTIKNTVSRNVTMTEGHKLHLHCSSHSNPPPFNFHWRLNGVNKVVRHTGLPSELIIDSVFR